MSAGPAAVFANLLASLGGPRWAGLAGRSRPRLSGRRSVNQLSAVLGAAASVVHVAVQGPPAARRDSTTGTTNRLCHGTLGTPRTALLLRDADSGQIDHMAADSAHGPH